MKMRISFVLCVSIAAAHLVMGQSATPFPPGATYPTTVRSNQPTVTLYPKTTPFPRVTPIPVSRPVVSALPSKDLTKELEALRAANAAIIAKQNATLEQLDALAKSAQQIKMMTHRN